MSEQNLSHATDGELIPVFEHEGKQAASGRQIHAYLGVATPYAKWFARMVEYGFTNGQDYVDISVPVPTDRTDRAYEQTDHAVTIDMAKELGMIQRTPEGKRIRQYFIEVEKRAQQSMPAVPPTRAALAQMVLDAEAEIEAANAKIELDAPKVRYHERFVAETDDIITIAVFASQWESTEPTVRKLLLDKGVAVRRRIGQRWSKSKNRLEEVFEWRPRQGTRYAEWFKVLPQHNAPRHHNGQVKQTMYLFTFHSEDLAMKLGLTTPALDLGGEDE